MRKQKYTFRDRRVIRAALARIDRPKLLGDETVDFMESLPLTTGQLARLSRGAK